MEAGYDIRALDESTWAAFAALVERNNGIFGGCWCMGFHSDDDRRSAAVNRQRKLDRVRAGTAHAALVSDGEDCVGWCQFGTPDEVSRIKNRAAYEKGQRPRLIGGSGVATSARDTGVKAWPPRRSPVRSI